MKSLLLIGGLLTAGAPQDQKPPGPSGPTQPPGREPAAKKFSELRLMLTDKDRKPVDPTLAIGAIVIRPKTGPARTMNLSLVIPDAPPSVPDGAQRAELPAEGDFLVTAVLIPPAVLDRAAAGEKKGETPEPPKAPHAKPKDVKPLPSMAGAYLKAEIETPDQEPSFSAEATILVRDRKTTVHFEVPFRGQEKSSTDEKDPSRRVK